MRLRVLEEAKNRALGRDVRLLDRAGAEIELDDLRAGRPTVVAFWSRHCGPALEQLPAMAKLRQQLDARGAALIVITEEQRADELTQLLAERAPGLEVYHDHWRDGTLAFQSWGTPQYFVLDASGRLRFEYSDLDAVLRQVDAVTTTPRAAAL
jgi:peroxiredoxin